VTAKIDATATKVYDGSDLATTNDATKTSPVGVYKITGSGLAAKNGNHIFQRNPGNATALDSQQARLQRIPNLARIA
jgi:type IV secretory pathway protease TraF